MRKTVKVCAAAVVVMLFVSMGQALQRQERGTEGESRNQTTPRVLRAKNSRIKSITILQEAGVRPHFSPDGQQLVYDRKDEAGFYNVYISDLNGRILRSLTKGNPGIAQRNNGNARFDHSGQYIIFISEEADHFLKSNKSVGDSGVGLFSNVWAADVEGRRFWRLTNIPIKRRMFDKVAVVGSVNPVFSRDGRTLVWTERYAEGGNNKWGKWRLGDLWLSWRSRDCSPGR